MLQQVLRTITRFRMISPGQRISVACSGGPDSTALLLILNEVSAELGCTVSVCHFNHRLRGNDSDQDEQFVRELAGRLGLDLRVEQADVRERAESTHSNIEGKARDLRYQFFASLIEEGFADRVAVGHTADDQAETVIHRVLRGAGTRGMAGIYPVAQNRIIRPLIEVRRSAIVNWLKARNQPWQEDATNRDLRRTRNRIRHQILPLLHEFNPKVVDALADTAEIARDEEHFWKNYLPQIVSEVARADSGRIVIDTGRLRKVHPAVVRRILRWAVGEASMNGPAVAGAIQHAASMDFEHTQALLHLACEGQSGSRLTLPGKIVARREFAHLTIERETLSELPGFIHRVQVPGSVEVPEIGSAFSFEIVPIEGAEAGYNRSAALFDERVGGTFFTVRNWHPGDAYQPKGHRRRRKLKELFRQRKIALSQRKQWPVIVAENRVIWARGLDVAEDFSPNPHSTMAILLRESSL